MAEQATGRTPQARRLSVQTLCYGPVTLRAILPAYKARLPCHKALLTDFACRLVEDLCGFQDEQGGVPQDEVTFDTDANEITNVSAQDKLGKPRSLFWRSIVLKSWWRSKRCHWPRW